MKKLVKQKSIEEEFETFQVALHAYFGLSDNAILSNMRGMTKGKIAYRLMKARKVFGILVKRSDYRDGKNKLSRKVLVQFKDFAERRLQLNDLT